MCSDASAGNNVRTIFILTLAFLCLLLLKGLLSYVLNRKCAETVADAQLDLTKKLMRETLDAEYRVFIEANASRFMQPFEWQIDYSIQCLQAIASVWVEASLLVLLAAFAVYLNAPLAMFLAVAVVGYSVLLKFAVLDKMGLVGQQRFQSKTRWNHLMFGMVSAIRDIKIMNLESLMYEGFSGMAHGLRQIGVRGLSLQYYPKLFGELFFMVALSILIVTVSVWDAKPAQSLPALVAFIVVVLRMIPSVQMIYSQLNSYKNCAASMAQLETTSDYLSRQRHVPVSSDVPFERHLRVANVTYRYPGSDRNVLSDVSVEIPKNGLIAIIGSSGSGKSTFLDVFSGLLQATDGRFFMDGNPIDPFESNAVRRLIGYVPQQVNLLDDSIGYNISLRTNYQDDMESVVRAAKGARIHDYIESLPGRYDAPVGERGINLSGGQRQRIGIARALYKSPKILLLDEATSAIDPCTERDLFEELFRMKTSMTILFAAHKLYAIERFDSIIVFEGGRIAAVGKHAELLATFPAYASLLSVQHGGQPMREAVGDRL